MFKSTICIVIALIGLAAFSQHKETLKNEVWQMEELYWDYVEKNDTVSYKTLWHDDFVGYPSFGNNVSGKSKIAIWIPELHKDRNLKFSYKLYKKAVNAIDDVFMVFYDADEIWTDSQNKVVRKETLKFTHTWKKYGDNWMILGGMAGIKEVLDWTLEEQENAKKELGSLIEVIITGAKNLDIEKVMKPYSNSEDFLLINPDGSVTNYNGMKEINAEAFQQLKAMTFETTNQEFRFLNKDLILVTWFGKNKQELKTGSLITIDSYVGSMLFKKANNSWFIIYAHESSSQPIEK